MHKTTRPRLADAGEECFMLILQLRAAAEFGSVERLRENIHRLLDHFERRAKQMNYSQEEISTAKFAIVAFMDETILASQWSQKEQWLSHTLGMALFNRMDSGEEFFRRLAELMKAPKNNAALLEVFYLCMALGFRGKYLVFEQEKLGLIKDDLYKTLVLALGKHEIVLSPHGRRREEIAEVVGGVPVWTIAMGAGAVGIVFYIVMLLLSNHQLGQVLNGF